MLPAKKIQNLPPYIFARIKALTLEAARNKKDVIDLAMGNPDLPTPKPIVDRLVDSAAHHPNTHRYPQAKGMPKYRKAVADWMKRRFDVSLNPETDVCALIGSKEGIAHLCAAYMEPGDLALTPSPCYPVHFFGVVLNAGQVYNLPINAANNYLPELEKIPEDVAQRAKIMFLNYPNNPTTAIIEDPNYLKEVIRFAKKYDILVCYDNAYSEIAFDGYKPESFFQTPGAWDVGLEFHSFSKTYNMAGWRLGWACGRDKLIEPLIKFKSYTDYGVPTFIQLSGVKALEDWPGGVTDLVDVYRRRRDYLCDGLKKLGWDVQPPKATMYVWARIPEKYQSMGSLAFCEKLARETGIAFSPGVGFGKEGEGYVRIALVTHDRRFYDMLVRLKKFQGITGVSIREPKHVISK